MQKTFLSHFTPSMMKAEDLESLFVQREALAKRLVELIRESALTRSKHHTLLVGPRGIGKTHLVALIYFRVQALEDLESHLRIAWLREEEWGITSFLDLILSILRALQAEYPNDVLGERMEALYSMSPDVAERAGAALLKEYIGNRTLLLLIENLDEVFKGLGEEGQKRLRAFLQENSLSTILATAQSLFNGVALQSSPFYGFFRIHHLNEFSLDDAVQLLLNIARLQGDNKLASFIQTPVGRSRIRAVRDLAGGNPRVYVIFSEFLTRESLEELIEPFLHTLDELTPYYQARISWLSPQQRKIIEFLCERRGAIAVKEIAQRCFITHQTASSQLKDLREKGYVRAIDSERDRREAYYELREPLMRLCIEIKKYRSTPVQLIVDFLRLWHTHEELSQKLAMLQPSAKLEREYVLQVLQATEKEVIDPRWAACLEDYKVNLQAGNLLQALQAANDLVALSGHPEDCLAQGICLLHLQHYEEALTSFDKAVEGAPTNSEAWGRRGIVLGYLERHEEALASFDKAIELNPNDGVAWCNRGLAENILSHYEEALASYTRAIELNQNNERAWHGHALALGRLGRPEHALTSFNKAIELNSNNEVYWFNYATALSQLQRDNEALVSLNRAIALKSDYYIAWHYRGKVLANLGRYEESLESLDRAIEIYSDDTIAWSNRGIALLSLGRNEAALASLEKAIELNDDNAVAWFNRGIAQRLLSHFQAAVSSFDKAIGLKPDYGEAWRCRGLVLSNLGRNEEALASFDKAIELDLNDEVAWHDKGVALSNLGAYEEALAVFNKEIELNPYDEAALVCRGGVLGYLGRYEEAIASLANAIEIDPTDPIAWSNRGLALSNLEFHEEALAAFNKAIELGVDEPEVFFDRVIILLILNRWEDGYDALSDAFEHFPHSYEASLGATRAIIHSLFNNDTARWRSQAEALAALYVKYKALSVIGLGVVSTIPALISPMISATAAQAWRDVWCEVAGGYAEFEIPLRLLKTAVRYIETQGDNRVLLELPVEERNILEPLLKGEEPPDAEA